MGHDTEPTDAPRRLLVAYDGSSSSRHALRCAAGLVRRGDAVVVVNVMAEPGVSSRIGPYTVERDRQAHLLDDAAGFLARRGIEARRVAAVGFAATEILAAAKRMGANVIVVGRRRGRLPHVLGSVSGRIVRRASCDVLVVHEPTSPRGAARHAA